MKVEEGQIPAGSQPPIVPDTAEAPQEDPRVYAGKYQSPDDLEKGYGELSKKIGDQSGELGDARAQNKVLTDQLTTLQTEASQRIEQAQQEEPPTDYENMLSQVAKQYDDGDISFEQAMQQSNSITAQQVQSAAQVEIQNAIGQVTGQFEQTLADRDNQVVVDKFNQDNPDFAEMQQSGALGKIIADNPLHDDLSAYYAIKAQMAFEQGKSEQARVAAGSEPATKVLSKPGTSIQAGNKPKAPMTKAEMRESMLSSIGDT